MQSSGPLQSFDQPRNVPVVAVCVRRICVPIGNVCVQAPCAQTAPGDTTEPVPLPPIMIVSLNPESATQAPPTPSPTSSFE